MRLLVTRPGEAGERTAQALRERGHEVLHAPVMKIEAIADADIGEHRYAALLMTSANAARAVAAHPQYRALTAIPVLAVGEATRAAALATGFADVVSAGGDVQALAALARARLAKGSTLLYLAGEVRAGDLAGALEACGFVVRNVAIYRAVAESALPDGVADALRGKTIDGVLHFSRRSAEIWLALAKSAGINVSSLNCKHFCLSRQVAEPLIEAHARAIAVAARPDERAMLDLVAAP
jgi:uroporphyrinogen-III synthase